jgi:hypothetical protein
MFIVGSTCSAPDLPTPTDGFSCWEPELDARSAELDRIAVKVINHLGDEVMKVFSAR